MVMLRKFSGSGECYYGSTPNLEVLEKLEEDKFDCVWNLAKEGSAIVHIERKYVPLVLHAGIDDYKAPKDVGGFVGQLDKVVGMLRSGKKVFVHCNFGCGRTGLALASIAVMMGSDAETALNKAYSACSGPESKIQAEFVHKLAQSIRY